MTQLKNKNYRIYAVSVAVILIVALFYTACKKAGESPKNEAKTIKTSAGLIPNRLKDDYILSADTSNILNELYRSEAWKSIPAEVIRSIKNKNNPNLQIYEKVKIQAIFFDIAGSDPNIHYKSLVIYVYDHKFLPVIIQNIQQGDYKRLSIADLSGNDYMHVLVDKNDKSGKFKVEKEIQWDQIIGKSRLAIQGVAGVQATEEDTRTCMQKNTTFGGCMNCAIAECSADWVCTIGCGVEFVGCMAVFAASCAFHA